MEISSGFVGAVLKPLETEIAWRRTTNYAAATGDANPRYLDDGRKEGIVAPPMFSVAVTWPVSERIREYLDVPGFLHEILMTQVHYTEHLRFYRLIAPSDRLSIQGKVAAIMPHKAGTLMTLRYDAYDAAGALVFTEHIGGLMRGILCTDGGAGAEDIPGIHPGDDQEAPLWQVAIPISREAPFIYDGCTDICFPIHTSVRFARQVGLPGIIYQGTAALALAVREVTDRVTGGDPGRIEAISCRFTGMVTPGGEIRVHAYGPFPRGDHADIHFAVFNSEGKKAISNGVVAVAS